MGGRLDATNVVTPAVCALTPIDLDHQQWLGDTLTAIAAEKAGIIKPGVPVISAPQADKPRKSWGKLPWHTTLHSVLSTRRSRILRSRWREASTVECGPRESSLGWVKMPEDARRFREVCAAWMAGAFSN